MDENILDFFIKEVEEILKSNNDTHILINHDRDVWKLLATELKQVYDFIKVVIENDVDLRKLKAYNDLATYNFFAGKALTRNDFELCKATLEMLGK